MGFIPQITCRHCGNKFSAIHSRCPSCGTPRVQQTARSTPAPGGTSGNAAAPSHARANSNTRWQFIFGCILIIAVIVAVIILVTASIGGGKPVETPPPVEVSTPPPTTPPPTTPPPTTPIIPVTSVTITFLGEAVGSSFTQRIEWAPINLDADVYPTDALTTSEVKWRSSNAQVCTVDKDGVVTAVAPGTCEIIAECGGVAAKVNVLVP
jgi:hypothetical protein